MPNLRFLWILLVFLPLPLAAQTASIERIEITGNQYVITETYLNRLTQKAGDPYDEAAALRDFRALWSTAFLDDLVLDVTDGERGKVVTYKVVERPRVQAIDFVGSKELDASDITDKLAEEEADIPVDSFYDPRRVVKAESIIRAMLLDKGRTDGTVSSRVESLEAGGVKVVFDIKDEQKIRIRDIEFEGIEHFDEWRLRWGMKKTRETHALSSVMGGSTYTEEQYAEDIELVREVYLNNGYVDVSFGPPRMDYEDGSSRFMFWKKPRRWLKLTIPVSEGQQYRVGNISVEGADVLPEEFIKGYFKLIPGEIYDESKITKGLEKLREIYGARGYIQFTGFPIKQPVEDSDVVDVTINLNEDQQYFVNQIAFKGNTTTRDKVIRREMWLNEQDVMNMELLKMSIQRINQLGYFRPIEQPEIEPVEGEENKLNVTLRLSEQNRNQFTFGGGVSGLEGAFINLAFSTTNFMGRGETASFSVQTGSRTRNFQIAITDPYFLDKPMTLGFDVFKRTLRLPQFTRQDTGGSLVWGLPVKRFSRLFVNYNYSVINTSDPDPDLVLTPFDVLNAGQNQFLDPRFQGIQGNFVSSKITPSFVHNTTDNPLFPFRGKRYTASLGVAGGVLGGTVNYLKPTFEGIWYLPVSRTTNFGFRTMVSWLRGTRDLPPDFNPSIDDGNLIFDVEATGIPFFERFFLGGENQIRGYNIRSVGPRSETGAFIGGTKMMLFNAEYYIPLAGPLRAVLFFDAGQAFLETDPWSFSMFKELRTSTGAEMRFFVPVLNVPFRLIWAYNPNRDAFQPATAFRFGIGTTF